MQASRAQQILVVYCGCVLAGSGCSSVQAQRHVKVCPQHVCMCIASAPHRPSGPGILQAHLIVLTTIPKWILSALPPPDVGILAPKLPRQKRRGILPWNSGRITCLYASLTCHPSLLGKSSRRHEWLNLLAAALVDHRLHGRNCVGKALRNQLLQQGKLVSGVSWRSASPCAAGQQLAKLGRSSMSSRGCFHPIGAHSFVSRQSRTM